MLIRSPGKFKFTVRSHPFPEPIAQSHERRFIQRISSERPVSQKSPREFLGSGKTHVPNVFVVGSKATHLLGGDVPST
jgi:hypothetical protein